MDRHLNIFYAYRQGDFEDSDGERVLEDNVTRALIIALRSSDFLTQRFLKEFAGVNAQAPYDYDLQSRLGPDEAATSKRSRHGGKCLIVVAGRPEVPKSIQGTNADVSGGSRPDAWIRSTSTQFTALFENKLHGGISDAQIRRHIKVNFGEELEPVYPSHEKYAATERTQVPVVLLSWRDVYTFFRQLRDEQPLSIDPKSHFIVCQFLEYLEVLGMGEVRFTQEDFLTWESYTDIDRIRMLLGGVETLGDELAKEFGEHQVRAQRVSPGYLGVNVMHDSVANKPSDQAPHWSCGLAGRVLRLYIQCESKPLVEKLVKQRDQLIPSISEALWKARSFHGVRLHVAEKLHIVSGGSGKNASVWTGATSFPLELCQDEESLSSVVSQSFDALEYFLRPEVRKEKLVAAGRGISTWGVLGIEYQWNWLVLQKEGTEITERVKDVARQLKPCYEVLLEAFNRRPTSGRRRQVAIESP